MRGVRRRPGQGQAGSGTSHHGARRLWRAQAGQHTDTPTDWRPPRGLRGLAGLRADAPSEARSADGSRAGRRPPAHTAAGPSVPGTPAAPQAPATRPPRYAKGAGTEVPAPCRLTQPLPRRGLRPNARQSWRRRRIHRNMPPTTAAPRPAPPIRPSKPVWARPCFGLVAGTSGAT